MTELIRVKEFVQRMGGSISISSQDGVATTVKIELPEVGRRRRSNAQDTDS